MTDAASYPSCTHGKKIYERCESCEADARAGKHGGFERAPEASNLQSYRCFFCDEEFSGADAINHFGRDQSAEPACKIKAAGEFALLQALRNAEDTLSRHRADDSDTQRAMYSMIADHSVALRREEEKGYARGLKDARQDETPAPPVRGQHCTCAYYREDGFTIESGSPCSIHPNGCEHGRDWKTPCTECHRTLWGEPPPEQVKTTLNQESDRG